MRETVDSLKAPLRSLVATASLLAVAVLLAHAWLSLASGYDVNLVSGVWLALARDVRDGLFYRDLIGPDGYGGTRYFPLFFLLIAAFMRLGLDPVTAGHTASLIGAGVLATGGHALLRQLGLRGSSALGVTVLATAAPYFVQQSVFAIRTEPLAAGLALWGLGAVAAAMRRPAGSWAMFATATLLFTLAAAAKPTTVHAPAAALLALALARRWADVSRLGGLAALGFLLLVFGVDLLSEGRFIQSIRASALAGATPGGMLSLELLYRPVALIASSRILMITFLLAMVALIASPSLWRRMPALMLVTAGGVTLLALGTPGTILTNQIVEPYVAAVLFLGWFIHVRPGTTAVGSVVLAMLLIWTAGQNATRLAAIWRQDAASRLPAQRAALVAALGHCEGPVLAESPLVPILAGQSPILLDPFAFRVVTAQRPEVAEDLVARLSGRQFSCVVLEQDPDEPRGAGWYRHVHLGWPVIEAVLRYYEYRESIGGHRFYTARPF